MICLHCHAPIPLDSRRCRQCQHEDPYPSASTSDTNDRHARSEPLSRAGCIVQAHDRWRAALRCRDAGDHESGDRLLQAALRQLPDEPGLLGRTVGMTRPVPALLVAGTQQTHRLSGSAHDVWTLGRSRHATLTIRHPRDARASLKISRYHAEIIRCWDHWLLRSLTDASTRVDDVPLSKGTWIELEVGHRVEFGRVVILVVIAETAAEPASADDWTCSLASIGDAPTLRSTDDAAK